MMAKKHSELRFRLKPVAAVTMGLSLAALVPQGAQAYATKGVADGSWIENGGTPDGIRYSELTELTPANIAQKKDGSGNVISGLVEEYKLATGVKGSHMGAPLVVKNVAVSGVSKALLYVVTPYPNKLIAYDLDTGTPLWTFAPSVSEGAKGRNCCDSTNRGLAYSVAHNLIVYNLLDGYTVAVNASTGKQVWKTKIADPNVGVTTTGAPIIATGPDVVISGTSSGEMGTRGYVVALNLTTGKEVWRGYNTGPDTDVKITASTQNPYPKDQGVNLGKTSWEGGDGNKYLQGGSSTWGYLTYDPVSNLVFYGTSQPGVWNPDIRPGDNKWGASVFARDAKTGNVKWIYQNVAHDNWDYDSAAEIIPVTLDQPINGVNNVLVQLHKNGFAYIFERDTGKLLQANVFKEQNWAKGGIDLKTGLPLLSDGKTAATDAHNANAAKDPKNPAANEQNKYAKTDTWQEAFCPSPMGGHGWEPSSYSPKRNRFFVPTFNLCASIGAMNAEFVSGAPYMGMSMSLLLNNTSGGSTYGHVGDLIAWDPNGDRKPDEGPGDVSTGNIAWTKAESAPIYGGVLSTAGDLVFYTTLDPNNTFKALDASTGSEIWSASLECPSTGNPITWTGSDGHQRVAIYSGVGAMVGGMGAMGGNTGKPCSDTTTRGGTVHVYKLK